ncbi:hypothetical protein NUU61_001964 [Penicillium alfredii]|uniref:Zn(2)-C6 fungal-type domain-containing protein n=1 Tax=Penicillium alfredii TaxID=1506179 RepID=A0A9W9FRB3_9EURO|nr:uncharacterized protein NUU61_001964 [Penicillium alfredii]KAJ5104617.1 hypothetical protein NUU61_001964 [Penicillium alfredii]
MSGYYVGPFGRMLPGADGPSSEQQPERPANFPEPAHVPYQLPPPRAPANLQFGTDPFLRQRQQAEHVEAGRGPPADATSQRQRTEPLPSVRQLLTPVTGPNSPPSYSQPFGTPSSAAEHRDSTYPFRHHEPPLPSQLSPTAVHDRAKGRSESLPRSQTGSLPPLSQVAMQSPGDIRHHAATRSDPSATSSQHDQVPLHGTPFHEKSHSGSLSSPDAANRAVPAVQPHVVDERYVEGEGICYVYADGSHCPKSINGIPVNANWGITKAGKPRKRLAQACLTCREKKIKCHPNLPKCDQCQKSGRECRFENAPRGSRASIRGPQSGRYDAREGLPLGSYAASDASPSLYNIVRASDSATSLPGTNGHSPMSEGSMLAPSAGESNYEGTADADRVCRPQMSRFPQPFPGTAGALTRPVEHFESTRLPEYSEILGELKETNPDDPLVSSWRLDPYETDPETTMHYAECYLSHVNIGLYRIFPHAGFVLWLKSCHTKSAEDKMLLYAMMALGAVFSDQPDRVVVLRRFSRIARFAIHQSQHTLSLQLAQSYLIMSFWYYATGSLVGAWDAIGAAGRAVCGLRYNVESGGVIVDQTQVCDYGLHPQALIECRRRTFWAAFVLDRFSSFLSTSSTFISSDAALLRLPYRDDVYEAQQYAMAPYFQRFLNQNPVSPENDRSALSTMAFLIEIMAIWGDVSLHVFRLPHIPSDSYAQLVEEFHTTIIRQTDGWRARLPEFMTFSAINLERNIRARDADTFIPSHLFYHATLMKLYRHARHQTLRPEVLAQYIHRARYHAVEILRIALAFDQYSTELTPSRPSPDNNTPSGKTTLLNPFSGYVILSAVDVLSAAGWVAELPECISFIRGALAAVQKLARFWDSSLQVVAVLQRRLGLLVDVLNDRARVEDRPGFALHGPTLETKVHAMALPSYPPAALGEDLFAGAMPRAALLNTLCVDDVALSENSIVWIYDR